MSSWFPVMRDLFLEVFLCQRMTWALPLEAMTAVSLEPCQREQFVIAQAGCHFLGVLAAQSSVAIAL
jgi:hypothetical protein